MLTRKELEEIGIHENMSRKEILDLIGEAAGALFTLGMCAVVAWFAFLLF